MLLELVDLTQEVLMDGGKDVFRLSRIIFSALPSTSLSELSSMS
ncbi:hypothetical protein [Geothermobacter ehrlichii]|nr:hypothetical protein [Geothermobacter ehrlichii]